MNIIHPVVFDDIAGIRAWFTLKNEDVCPATDHRTITGLDLGSNTLSTHKEITRNRATLFEKIGLQNDWVALADQVHGSRVQFVSTGGTYPETDALVTDIPGLALAIQVADCAAVLLADSDSRMVAAIHAGWRGAMGEILPSVIEIMKNRGSRPSDLRAFISPCISLEHFEVGEEVAEQFPDNFVDKKNYEKPHINLKGFLYSQMLNEGLNRQFIQVDRSCTVGEPNRFYSYRREKEQSGRMMGIIQISVDDIR